MKHLSEIMLESKPHDGKVVIKGLSDGMYKFVEVKHGNQYMVQVWKNKKYMDYDNKSKSIPKDFSYLGELMYFDIEDTKQYPNEWVEEQVKRLK